MKKVMLTAAISVLTVTGALACEYGQHAADTDRTTVACSGGNCQAHPTTTTQSPAAANGVGDRAQDGRVAPKPVNLRPSDLAK
jgi:hypothetical protein